MASDSRALTLKLLADVADFQKKINQSEQTTEGFSEKVKEFGDKAKLAFAAAAAAAAGYAVKLAVDGVKAAIEDEAAQKRLATVLKSVAGATDDAVSITEEYITNLSLAYGIADDQLRPAYSRLARATGDLRESNKGLILTLDIAAATGKDVESVANALAKAYEGNFTSLARLGVGLTAAEMKTLGLEESLVTLSSTFAGAASKQADTFEGKMARLQVRFDETKETVGFVLLPMLEKLLGFFMDKLIPALENLVKKFDPLKKTIADNKDELDALWQFLSTYVVPILRGALKTSINGIVEALETMVKIVSTGVKVFKDLYDRYKSFVDFIKNNPLSKFLGKLNPFGGASFSQADFSTGNGFEAAFGDSISTPEVRPPSGAASFGVSGASLQGLVPGGKYSFDFLRARGLSDEAIQALVDRGLIETTTPEGYSTSQLAALGGSPTEQTQRFLEARAAGRLQETFGAPVEYNITVNGAIDAEGTARQILSLLNQQYQRGTGGAAALLGTF